LKYNRLKRERDELLKLVGKLTMDLSKEKRGADQLDDESYGSFRSDKTLSPLGETRYSLFVINILEDLTQDVLYYYSGVEELKPITRIYQTVPNVGKTFGFITK
jgi:hypothetical protein